MVFVYLHHPRKFPLSLSSYQPYFKLCSTIFYVFTIFSQWEGAPRKQRGKTKGQDIKLTIGSLMVICHEFPLLILNPCMVKSLKPGLTNADELRFGGCTNLQLGHVRVALHITTNMWHRMHTAATISAGWSASRDIQDKDFNMLPELSLELHQLLQESCFALPSPLMWLLGGSNVRLSSRSRLGHEVGDPALPLGSLGLLLCVLLLSKFIWLDCNNARNDYCNCQYFSSDTVSMKFNKKTSLNLEIF